MNSSPKNQLIIDFILQIRGECSGLAEGRERFESCVRETLNLHLVAPSMECLFSWWLNIISRNKLEKHANGGRKRVKKPDGTPDK
jgi:hypothetical protein